MQLDTGKKPIIRSVIPHACYELKTLAGRWWQVIALNEHQSIKRAADHGIELAYKLA